MFSLNMESVGSTPEEFRRVVQEDWAKWGAGGRVDADPDFGILDDGKMTHER